MLVEKDKSRKEGKDTYIIDNLYKKYVDDLYSYAIGFGFNKETAMDAIHDVFCKICLHEKELAKIENPKFYLLRTLRNQLIDIYRTKKDYIEVPPETLTDELPYKIKITIEDELIAEEERLHIEKKIEEIMNGLNKHQREIIYLRYMQECSYEEIAKIMHLSVPACRKLLYRTLTKLKNNNTLMIFYLLMSINIR